jgi:hypothetical protein
MATGTFTGWCILTPPCGSSLRRKLWCAPSLIAHDKEICQEHTTGTSPRLMYSYTPCWSSRRKVFSVINSIWHWQRDFPRTHYRNLPGWCISILPAEVPEEKLVYAQSHMGKWHRNLSRKWLPEPPKLMYSYNSLRKFHKEKNYGVHYYWWAMT